MTSFSMSAFPDLPGPQDPAIDQFEEDGADDGSRQ